MLDKLRACKILVELEEPVFAPTATIGMDDLWGRGNVVQAYPITYLSETRSE
jgi:hypothetical protein